MQILHRHALARMVNQDGYSLCAFDALWMVVGHGCDGKGELLGFFFRARRKAGWAHAHSRAIAEAVVGLRVVTLQPGAKAAAIARLRVGAPELLHRRHCLSGQILIIRSRR